MKNISVLFGFVVCGFILGLYYNHFFQTGFFKVRLFEIIQLVATLTIGSVIAFYFSRRQNASQKKTEMILTHLTSMLNAYRDGIEKIRLFMNNPSLIPSKSITLIFKELSSRISTLEKHKAHLNLDDGIMLNLRKSHDVFENLVVSETWSIDREMIYSEKNKQETEKVYSVVEGFIEDLLFGLYR